MLKSPKGRLTADGVAQLKKLRAAKKSYQAIASELGISITTVYNILKGRTHADE